MLLTPHTQSTCSDRSYSDTDSLLIAKSAAAASLPQQHHALQADFACLGVSATATNFCNLDQLPEIMNAYITDGRLKLHLSFENIFTVILAVLWHSSSRQQVGC